MVAPAVSSSLLAERGVDRRRAPRRAEDITLHYARENLIAAVLRHWDALGEDDVADPDLGQAVIDYQAAESAAYPEGQGS